MTAILILLGIAFFKEYTDYFSIDHQVEMLDVVYTIFWGFIGIVVYYLSIIFHISKISWKK